LSGSLCVSNRSVSRLGSLCASVIVSCGLVVWWRSRSERTGAPNSWRRVDAGCSSAGTRAGSERGGVAARHGRRVSVRVRTGRPDGCRGNPSSHTGRVVKERGPGRTRRSLRSRAFGSRAMRFSMWCYRVKRYRFGFNVHLLIYKLFRVGWWQLSRPRMASFRTRESRFSPGEITPNRTGTGYQGDNQCITKVERTGYEV